MSERILDGLGNDLEVGSRVRLYGWKPERDERDSFHGVVLEISDPDGDVDDEGRGVSISPRVTVRFDDGETDGFTSWSAPGSRPGEFSPFQCDDLELVTR